MDIEKLATSAVTESISQTDVLTAAINENDKEPSWDGIIYIHKDKNKSKEDIKRVPVQIKGKIIKEKKEVEKPHYRIGIVDLNNWQNDGGSLLFVAFFRPGGERIGIFYNDLLPIKIRILRGDNKGKKSINIALKPFPIDNDQKVSVLLNFYENMQNQTSFAKAPLFTKKQLENDGLLKNIVFPYVVYGHEKEDLEKALVNNDLYLYAITEGSTIPQPLLEMPAELHIIKTINADVKINDTVYYSSYKVEREKNGSRIYIGKSFQIEFSNEKNTISINFRNNGGLTNCIKDTEFFLALIQEKVITINGVTIPLSTVERIDTNQYKLRLAYLKDIKLMLNNLGVNQELDLDAISKKDEISIRNFVNAAVYNEDIGFGDLKDNPIYGRFKIANIEILIWANKLESGYYKLESFFSNQSIVLFNENDEKQEHPMKISHYSLLRKKDFIEAANIDYKKIEDDLDENEICDDVINQLTLFMLEMLKAYDEKSQKDENLLNLAESYCNWLANNSKNSEDNFILNKMQITRRRRDLNIEEKQELLNIANNNIRADIKCGAYLLLDNIEKAQECFYEIDTKLQDCFLEYPINIFGKLTRTNTSKD